MGFVCVRHGFGSWGAVGVWGCVLMPWGLSPTENSDSGDVFRVVQGNLPLHRGIVCVCTLIRLCEPVQEPGGSGAIHAEESTAAWRTLRLARGKPGLQKNEHWEGKKKLWAWLQSSCSAPLWVLCCRSKELGSLQPCP